MVVVLRIQLRQKLQSELWKFSKSPSKTAKGTASNQHPLACKQRPPYSYIWGVRRVLGSNFYPPFVSSACWSYGRHVTTARLILIRRSGTTGAGGQNKTKRKGKVLKFSSSIVCFVFGLFSTHYLQLRCYLIPYLNNGVAPSTVPPSPSFAPKSQRG